MLNTICKTVSTNCFLCYSLLSNTIFKTVSSNCLLLCLFVLTNTLCSCSSFCDCLACSLLSASLCSLFVQTLQSSEERRVGILFFVDKRLLLLKLIFCDCF